MKKKSKILSQIIMIVCVFAMIFQSVFMTEVFAHTETETKNGLVTTYKYTGGANSLTNDASTGLNVTYTNKDDGGMDIKVTCSSISIPEGAVYSNWDNAYFYLCGGIIRRQDGQTKKNTDGSESTYGFTAGLSRSNFAGRALWYTQGPNGEPYTHNNSNYRNLAAVYTEPVGILECKQQGSGMKETEGVHTVPKGATYLDKWTYALGTGANNENKKTSNGNKTSACNFEYTFTLTSNQVERVCAWMENHGFNKITVAMAYPNFNPGGNWEYCSDGCHGTGRIGSGDGSASNPWHSAYICGASGIGNELSCYGANHSKTEKHIKQDVRECTVYKYKGGAGFGDFQKTLTFDFNNTGDAMGTAKVTFTASDSDSSTSDYLSEKYTVGTTVATTTITKPGYHVTSLTSNTSGVNSLTKPSNKNYAVSGYPTNSCFSVAHNVQVNKDTSFIVTTAANIYTVTYYGNDATSGTMSASSHAYNTAKALTTNLYKRDGYTFIGWNTDKNATKALYTDKQSVKNLTSSHGGNIDLYAIWVPNNYNLKYVYNAPKDVDGNSREGQIVHTTKPANTTFNSWETISNPTLKGYIFNGWKLTGLTTAVKKYAGINTSSYTTIPAANDDYYYACGGKDAVGANRVYKNLHTGGNPSDGSSKWPTVTLSCYKNNSTPGWSPISYQLTLDTNGGRYTGSEANVVKVVTNIDYDQKYKLPTPSRNGYKFLGWQIYEITGDSDYKKYISTNTNPLTAGTVYKFAGGQEIYNLCYSDNASIKLVAIWGHDHDIPVFNQLTLDTGNEYIFGDDIDPTELADYCYYINTNEINDLTFKTNISVKSSPMWYDIDEYKLDLDYCEVQKDPFTAYDVLDTEYTDNPSGVFMGTTKTKEDFKIHIEGNAYKTCIPTVVMGCRWKDNYTSCNCSKEDLTFTGIPVTIIGDCEIPTVKNLEKLTDLTAIDLREVNEYVVSLTGQDDAYINDPSHSSAYPSGLIELCYFKISNLDNQKKANSGTGLTKTNYRKYNSAAGSDGLIYHIDFENFDLAKLNFETASSYEDTEKIFIGDIEFEYYLKDNVGNVLTNTDITSVFDMDTKLESFTYTPTNYELASIPVHNNGNTVTDIPIFKKGESAILTIDTTGFVDGLKIEFPESWYISEDYPLYMYWGDQSKYTDKSLEPITEHVFYLNTEDFNDDLGCWIQDFIFVLPLYADKSDLSQLTITAYKGANKITDQDIKINHNAGSQLESLSSIEHFKVSDKSILDDYRDSINYTY